jgi:hypothetical protein
VVEVSLASLLDDIRGTLGALTESQELFLRRLRRLRLEVQGDAAASFGQGPLPGARPAAPQPARMPAAADARVVGDPPLTQVRLPPQPEPELQLAQARTKVGSRKRKEYPAATAERRDYDFFTELDEKLAGLR